MLELAVRSLLAQDLPSGTFEFIVVDNASSDDTKEYVESLLEANPALRYFYERKEGLSAARNAAWKVARASIVAFMDDDAIAAPDWLKSTLAAFERFPSAGCIGGRVKLFW